MCWITSVWFGVFCFSFTIPSASYVDSIIQASQQVNTKVRTDWHSLTVAMQVEYKTWPTYTTVYNTPLLPRQRRCQVCVSVHSFVVMFMCMCVNIHFALNLLHTQNEHQLRYWTTRYTGAPVFGYQIAVFVCMYVSMPNNSPKRDRKHNKTRISPLKHTHTLSSVTQSACCHLSVAVSVWKSIVDRLQFSVFSHSLASSLCFQFNYYTLVIIELVVVQHAMVYTRFPHRNTSDRNRVRERVNVWITLSIYNYIASKSSIFCLFFFWIQEI